MAWIRKDGKSIWVDPPWISNPNFREEMKALGKGPASWYRANTWVIQYKALGGHSYIVGEGTNPIELPSYESTDEKNQVTSIDTILGNHRVISRIWSETEGLMADPLKATGSSRRTHSGTWVDKNDLRLFSRSFEILGIIEANPGIRISALCLIYNTTKRNIIRIFMILSAAGVSFSRLQKGQVNIRNYGVFDKKKVIEIFRKSDGLEAIVLKAKCVFDDVSDKRTGKVKLAQVKQELGVLWEQKLQKQQ